MDKNICGAMYYMQRLLACRANEQLYNKESDFFIGNSAMLKKNKWGEEGWKPYVKCF